MKEFTVNSNDAGQRVDKFILKAFPKLSKGVMCKAVRTKNVKLNGKRCEISTVLSEGDVLRIFIKDELLGEEKKSQGYDLGSASAIAAEDIVYEDENILLINKKIGVMVHSDSGNSGDTVVDRVRKYLAQKGEFRPEDESTFAPAVCNRLDRNTSGIVIAAKNAAALREINRKIRDNEISKSYLCLTAVKPPKDADEIRAYHYKDSATNTVKIRKDACEGYKEIITKYKYLRKQGDLNLVEVTLVTGRTHQIRAHMAFIGSSLAGDTKYGNRAVNEKYKMKYQALCAYKLRFEETKGEGCLKYLEGKVFSMDDVWFLK